MNTLEDRLRAALHAHAEDFTAHVDAWQQLRARNRAGGRSRLARTLARTRSQPGPGRASRSRRHPGRGLVWSRFVVPAAAAAAVIAIVVGATVLTSPGGPHGSSGAGPAPRPASGAPAPPGRNSYLIQSDPPVSAIVQVKITVDGSATWVSVWFGWMRGNPGRTVLCSQIAITGTPTDGFCEPAQIPAGHVAVLTGNNGVVAVGAASGQVASVSAQWPGGHSTGRVVWSRGFPARVWLLSDPVQESSRIIFRDAAGADAGKLTVPGWRLPISHPRSGGITIARYPTGFAGPRPGTITAYLTGGQVGFWASANFLAGFTTVPVSGQPGLSVFHIRAMAPASSKLVEFFGYAPQNVVRVTLRLSDGRQFSARTSPGWPGSGLRLWSVPVPGGVPSVVRYLALGYDAANQVVSQLTVSGPG